MRNDLNTNSKFTHTSENKNIKLIIKKIKYKGFVKI